jgi:hypothetical protein
VRKCHNALANQMCNISTLEYETPMVGYMGPSSSNKLTHEADAADVLSAIRSTLSRQQYPARE